MTILVDTREQDNGRAAKRYEGFGVKWRKEKLDFGDYSVEVVTSTGELLNLSNTVAIERKMSLDELCNCYTHDRERFAREFQRATDVGAKIYLLVENSSWEMIYGNKYESRMKPNALAASVVTWLSRYNCTVLMCKELTSGKLIKDVLYYEARRVLTKTG